jgi:adenylate kinase
MILILIGPPGSGKSTQSHLLVEALKLPFVSVGELIRKALKTEAFASYKKKVDEGNLLPDQVVFEVIQDKLEHLDLKKGFIMEGFPRTVGQAAWMDTFLQQKGAKVHRTLYLNTMGIDTIKHRILSRHQCSVCSRVFSLDELQGKVQCPVCSGDLYSRQDDHEEVLKQIKTGNYGLSYIISNGGFMDSLMRLVWTRDKNFNDKPDPEEAEWFPIVTSEDVQKLSVQNGSIYFLSGYMPLAPDWEMDCIGKELLMTQGVAVLGETRLGYFFSNWKSQRDGGLHSTIYYFTQSLLGGKSIGESLYHSFAYSSDTEYYNAYSYGVLYGDPSLSLEQSKKAEDKMPGAPRNLKASLSGNNVTLSWSPATKGTYTIDGYTVFRGTDRNVLSYLTNVNSSALNWEDKSVSPGNTYFYYIKAFDIKKNFSEASNTVSITIKPEDKDTTPPQITIFEPQNNFQSKQAEIKVSGQITDNDSGVSIATINNKRITLDKEGNFSELLSLKEGDNTITVKASDNAGNEAQVRISVNYTKEEIPVDNMPPLIKIFSPKNGDTFSKDTVEINGRIWDEDSGIDRASMNGLNLILSRDGTFSTNAILQGGTNQLLFEAWDKAGNYASEEFFLVLTQETVIQLTIGKNIAMIDGIPVPLDVPPIILNGRTMVPIRFISEAFGAEVQWDAETRTVRIYFEKTFTRVTLQINNTISRINDKIVTLDAPPHYNKWSHHGAYSLYIRSVWCNSRLG